MSQVQVDPLEYSEGKSAKAAYFLAYARTHREQVNAKNRRSYRKHRERRYQRHVEYNATPKARQKVKAALLRWRLAALDAYGGRRCRCCGETTLQFLAIDHIYGGGNRHRKSLTTNFYRWLGENPH